MGMYTEVFFRAEIAKEASEIIERFRKMERYSSEGLPDHPFFKTARGQWMFDSDSAYFPGPPTYIVIPAVEDTYAKYDPSAPDRAILQFRANLKNYDQEVSKFFDWVDPYVYEDAGTFLGYELYEEGNTPHLYFKR